MNWTESTPLSPTNLNSLESRIASALNDVNTGKTNLYNALVAKGVTPGTQAFADLVTAINSMLVPSGNAIAGDVLTGKTFSRSGAVGLTGTMPNRSGDTAAVSVYRDGTTLKFRASDGYRGGVSYVTHTDANDIAANIKKGVTIRGQTGTYNNIVFSAGENVQMIDTGTKHTSSGTAGFHEFGRITVSQSGVYRVSYAAYEGGATKMRLRVGSTTYTERVLTGNYVTYTEDVTVSSAGGVIYLEFSRDYDDTYSLWVKDFAIKTLESKVFEMSFMSHVYQ